jgi:conjugative transfer signal peptidase TraF
VSAAVALAVLVAGLLPVCGIRINTSYSLPMGIYVRTSDPRAGLIEFCPEGRFAAESSARGYRTPGFCPDGAVPLLKPVVAQPGDMVEMSAAGIAVNGHLLAQTAPVANDRRGRLLKPYAQRPPRQIAGTLCYWPLQRRPRDRLGGVVVQPRVLRQPLHGSDSDAPDPGAIETIMDLQSMNLCR